MALVAIFDAAVMKTSRVAILAFVAGCSTVAAQDLKIGGAGPLIGTMQMLAEAFNRSHPGTQVAVAPAKDGKILSMGTKKGIEYGLKGVYEGSPFLGFS